MLKEGVLSRIGKTGLPPHSSQVADKQLIYKEKSAKLELAFYS